MGQARGNPGRRARQGGWLGGLRRVWLAALLAILGLATTAVRAEAALTVYFDTSAYSGNVWLQVQDPNYASTTTNFQATYAGGTAINFVQSGSNVLMSVPVPLSAIGSGGLTITYSQSAVLFLFYDDPTANSRTAAPAYPTSTQRFQPFELTMTGGSGDQGNLTAINYFTAPLSIKSYAVNPATTPSAPVLQQTGFGSYTAAQLGAQFRTATGGAAAATVTNATGGIVRYLGPSSFTSSNPWPSFLPYLQSINTAGQATTIQRTNGFNFAAPQNTPVYQFGANMTATVGSDGTITTTGSITATANTAVASGNPPLPSGGAWTGATMTFSASDMTALNNLIYGQSQNSAVSFTGSAWSDFQTFTQNTLMYPGQAHNVTTNPSLYDLGAYSTTVAMFIGEVTTGLLGGFFNSNYVPSGQSTAIKDMASNSWWSLNPIVGYATIQPSNQYYNVYAGIIFNASGNTVYGVPYSDRFGSGPLVNTVYYNGSNVGYWTVGVGAPLGAATTPVGSLTLQLLSAS
jgi:hypothetical protein